MIKRFVQLIKNALRRRPSRKDRRKKQRRSRVRRRLKHSKSTRKGDRFLSSARTQSPSQNKSQKRSQSGQPEDPNYITYTIPRSEIVTALNRTLKQLPERAAANVAPADAAPITLKGVTDAAYLCEQQGRLGDAEQLYKQALNLSLQKFGTQHLAIAPHLTDLALIYCQTQQYAQAKPLFTQVLYIRKHHQPSDHTDIGETLYRLAIVHRHLEQYRQAESLFQQALAIFVETLGEQHPRTKAIHTQLVKMLTVVIESGYFEYHFGEPPSLDLERLSETCSWAKPDWIRPVSIGQQNNDYSWIALHYSPENQSPENRSPEDQSPENQSPEAQVSKPQESEHQASDG